jgi:hypothetical protein
MPAAAVEHPGGEDRVAAGPCDSMIRGHLALFH